MQRKVEPASVDWNPNVALRLPGFTLLLVIVVLGAKMSTIGLGSTGGFCFRGRGGSCIETESEKVPRVGSLGPGSSLPSIAIQ